jgi:hypothetical protein
MKLISSLIICLALSACATDYVSQLAQPNYGMRALNSEENVDPALLMNGVYTPRPSGAFCLTGYRCSLLAPLWSAGSAP